MTSLYAILLILPIAYGIAISILLSILITKNKFSITAKKTYLTILFYTPILIISSVVYFIVPNSTSEGSLITVKILEFFLPFIWIVLPIWVQTSYTKVKNIQSSCEN